MSRTVWFAKFLCKNQEKWNSSRFSFRNFAELFEKKCNIVEIINLMAKFYILKYLMTINRKGCHHFYKREVDLCLKYCLIVSIEFLDNVFSIGNYL